MRSSARCELLLPQARSSGRENAPNRSTALFLGGLGHVLDDLGNLTCGVLDDLRGLLDRSASLVYVALGRSLLLLDLELEGMHLFGEFLRLLHQTPELALDQAEVLRVPNATQSEIYK